MKGRCIDTGGSTVLEKGEVYHLFLNGPDHFYVSKFDNKNAHFGCFGRRFFEPVLEIEQDHNEDWPPEPIETQEIMRLDRSKIYKASLIWREKGYQGKELKDYYIKPLKTHAYFYHDEKLQRSGGCFPLKWFTNFEEIEYQECEEETDEQELLPEIEWEQMSLF